MTINPENPKIPIITVNGDIKTELNKNHIQSVNHKTVYEKALEEATLIDGNEGELPHPDDIPWLDISLVKEGLELIDNYFATYVASTVLSNVTFAVAIKPVSTLVFCDDKPLELDTFFRRFVGKVHGILKLFKVLLDPVEGKRIIYKTRKMHALAVKRLDNVGNGRTLPEMVVMKEEPWMRETAEAVKKDMEEIGTTKEKIPKEVLENLSWNTKVPFSQFGLVYFTTGFFGCVWLTPELYGMKDRNNRKMKGMIHIWAIMVKMLGLKDEFNIYINPDPEVIDRVVREVYVHSLQTIDPLVVFLIGKVTEAINNYVPMLTVNGTLCLTMRALGCKKLEHIWKVMSLKDKVMYYGVGGLNILGGTRTVVSRFQNWLMQKILNSLFVKVLGKHD